MTDLNELDVAVIQDDSNCSLYTPIDEDCSMETLVEFAENNTHSAGIEKISALPVQLLRDGKGIYGIGIVDDDDRLQGAMILRPDRLSESRVDRAALQMIPAGSEHAPFRLMFEECMRASIHLGMLARKGLDWPRRSRVVVGRSCAKSAQPQHLPRSEASVAEGCQSPDQRSARPGRRSERARAGAAVPAHRSQLHLPCDRAESSGVAADRNLSRAWARNIQKGFASPT